MESHRVSNSHSLTGYFELCGPQNDCLCLLSRGVHLQEVKSSVELIENLLGPQFVVCLNGRCALAEVRLDYKLYY